MVFHGWHGNGLALASAALSITHAHAQVPAQSLRPVLVIHDTTQFEPTTWSLELTGTAGQPRMLTEPELEYQTLQQDEWVGLGSLPRDDVRLRAVRPTGTKCREPSLVIKLEAGKVSRSLHELAEGWIVTGPGRYRARAHWSEGGVTGHRWPGGCSDWVEFQVQPAGADAQELLRAQQAQSPLWDDYLRFLALPGLSVLPLWFDWRSAGNDAQLPAAAALEAFACGQLPRTALPARVAVGVQARVIAWRIGQAQSQPTGERAALLAALLTAWRNSRRTSTKRTTMHRCASPAACWRSHATAALRSTTSPTPRLPGCARIPRSSGCGSSGRSGGHP